MMNAPRRSTSKPLSTSLRETRGVAVLARRVARGGFLLLASTLALATPPSSAQDASGAEASAAGASAPVRIYADVRDARGRVPDDLAPADVEIAVDGVVHPASAVIPQAPRRLAGGASATRIAVYFDQSLASNAAVRRASTALAQRVRKLVDLGEVELVMADEEVDSVLRSRDALVIEERLGWTLLNDPGRRRVLALRERVLGQLRERRALPLSARESADVVLAAIDEEVELVRDRQDLLLSWAASASAMTPAEAPRLLVLVGDGFDLDPIPFYSRWLDEEATRLVAQGALEMPLLKTEVERTGRLLAGLGWTVVPLALESVSGEGIEAIDFSNIQVQSPTSTGGFANPGDPGAPPPSTGAGITLKPGSIFRRKKDPADEPVIVPDARFVDALAPLEILAESTGGRVVISESGLVDALDGFADRTLLVADDALAADVDLARLSVRPNRPGLRIAAPGWVSAGFPEAVAGVFLHQMIVGREIVNADLDVAALLHLDDTASAAGEASMGRFEARLDVRDLLEDEDGALGDEASDPGEARLRITVAIDVPGEAPRLVREILPATRLRDLREWRWERDLEIPPRASDAAVLIEDLDRGRWGVGRAAVMFDQLAGLSDGAQPLVIAIDRPDEEMLTGRVKFTTQVYDKRVERVVFELDERAVEEARRPPFEARVDLGRSPRRQALAAVAYDADGVELGRDTVLINAGSGGLAVDIIRPTDLSGTGLIEVEASIAVPLERRLDRVLFFWNNEPVATQFIAPFRQKVLIPEEAPVGYIRVVAMLDDGTVAEDVAFMNGNQLSERVDVNLVELYVVVTDDKGRPVRGLNKESFRIREEGREQEIDTFSDASDLPITLGMAIDSSASMFVKLPSMQRAAADFLRSTFTEDDRAFIVDFDTQPRLARGLTGDLDRVVRAIDSLEAGGRTALWESIVYSLVQLQGVRGRKALIVFSDGADEDDQFPYSSCIRFARKMGVPIYLILMRDEPKDSMLSLFNRSFRSRVDQLVNTTGGRVFYAKEYKDLGDVYDEIEYELRSQYLLTYYPTDPARSGVWRDVDVDVEPKGLRPRTLSGYWQ